jgi:acetylornithine deacetylase/succinyl-diaminopimelate desuccinylase-like protein
MDRGDSVIDRLLDLTLQIQQIPAPTFREARRAAFVRDLFLREGIEQVEIDPAGNVLARLPGVTPDSAPLIVSAHLDTVFPEDTDLTPQRSEERITAPGIGDNSLGVAALFGLLWRLRERGVSLPGDLWLVANVGEEGLGDLCGMRALVDRFGASPRAYLVLEGMAFGHIYHRGIGVRRYRITTHAAGGHSWTDYGKPSAIHELAELTSRISALKLPEHPRTTLNVGRIWGGTSINTVAAEAALELDMRSEDAASLESLVRRVDELVVAAHKPGVSMETELIGDRPPGVIPPDHPLIQLAESCLRGLGESPSLIGGSTDANVPLSRGYPALVLGLTKGSGAHTTKESINLEPLERGLESVAQFVGRAWDSPA